MFPISWIICFDFGLNGLNDGFFWKVSLKSMSIWVVSQFSESILERRHSAIASQQNVIILECWSPCSPQFYRFLLARSRHLAGGETFAFDRACRSCKGWDRTAQTQEFGSPSCQWFWCARSSCVWENIYQERPAYGQRSLEAEGRGQTCRPRCERDFQQRCCCRAVRNCCCAGKRHIQPLVLRLFIADTGRHFSAACTTKKTRDFSAQVDADAKPPFVDVSTQCYTLDILSCGPHRVVPSVETHEGPLEQVCAYMDAVKPNMERIVNAFGLSAKIVDFEWPNTSRGTSVEVVYQGYTTKKRHSEIQRALVGFHEDHEMNKFMVPLTFVTYSENKRRPLQHAMWRWHLQKFVRVVVFSGKNCRRLFFPRWDQIGSSVVTSKRNFATLLLSTTQNSNRVRKVSTRSWLTCSQNVSSLVVYRFLIDWERSTNFAWSKSFVFLLFGSENIPCSTNFFISIVLDHPFTENIISQESIMDFFVVFHFASLFQIVGQMIFFVFWKFPMRSSFLDYVFLNWKKFHRKNNETSIGHCLFWEVSPCVTDDAFTPIWWALRVRVRLEQFVVETSVTQPRSFDGSKSFTLKWHMMERGDSFLTRIENLRYQTRSSLEIETFNVGKTLRERT